jgi:hypothetical protein
MTHLKLMIVTTAMIAATTSFASADGKLWTVAGDHAACTDLSDFLDVGSGQEVITSTESCIRLREGTLVYLDTAKDGPVNLKYSCLRPFRWFTSKRCYWTNTWAIMPEDIGSSSEHVTTPASQPAMQLAPPAPVQAIVPAAPVQAVVPAAPVQPIVPAAPVQAIVPAAPVQATAPIAPPTL